MQGRLALGLFLAALGSPLAAEPIDTFERGRALTAAAARGDEDTIVANSEPGFIRAVGGEAALRAFISKLPAQLGNEIELDHERAALLPRGVRYARIAKFSKAAPTLINVLMSLDGGLIMELQVQPAGKKSPAPNAQALAKTRLRLPFGRPPEGHAWYATNAGEAKLDNYHPRLDTHYAIDISPRRINAPVEPNLTIEQHACWGLPILAAAAGTVATARDGEPDVMIVDDAAPHNTPGNRVIVDHGNGEFTLYAHLRNGSVKVKPGDALVSGQELGQCGNSDSARPHLHFQLMDGPDLDTAAGIPPIFYDYFAPFRHVEKGGLVRGDVVLPGMSAR